MSESKEQPDSVDGSDSSRCSNAISDVLLWRFANLVGVTVKVSTPARMEVTASYFNNGIEEGFSMPAFPDLGAAMRSAIEQACHAWLDQFVINMPPSCGKTSFEILDINRTIIELCEKGEPPFKLKNGWIIERR